MQQLQTTWRCFRNRRIRRKRKDSIMRSRMTTIRAKEMLMMRLDMIQQLNCNKGPLKTDNGKRLTQSPLRLRRSLMLLH